ncbi:MAG: hypothetical protein KF778_07805 [Rhodocyclaceae bacterium]|nr:hypothetical protein [Rhodocyclaceae bacterium]MBX3668294.1 hypothetical protein [Rhodocyclaceae bacterium]
MSGPRKTTFLTTEQGRAPSAYHVSETGDTQRVRQEHKHGPTVTSEKRRIQAFTATKDMAWVVHDNVKDTVEKRGYSVEAALRLEIMDGLASPLVASGRGHVEVSEGNIGKGNPHVSGGTVAFPAKGSPLENYDALKQATQQRKHSIPNAPSPQSTTMSKQITPQAQEFNRRALAEQQTFAQAVLNPRRD